MASIENSTPTDFGPHCRAMDEPGLMAQQLVQQGAIHALETLLMHGCTEQTVQDMLASLRSNMLVIEAVAREKGFKRLFAESDGTPPSSCLATDEQTPLDKSSVSAGVPASSAGMPDGQAHRIAAALECGVMWTEGTEVHPRMRAALADFTAWRNAGAGKVPRG